MRRVLVVDPYPLVRSGLEQLVHAHPSLVLAAAVADVADALGASADVAVLGHGDEAAIAVLAALCPVLVLLDQPAPEPATLALRAGASAVLHRGAEPPAIARALLAAALGAAIVDLPVAEHVMRPQAPERVAFPQLTERERDVLRELSRGATNGQIALALGLTAKTVRNHMSSICLKLRVLDRAQAVIVAREAGLGL